jgi:hypothetical protein
MKSGNFYCSGTEQLPGPAMGPDGFQRLLRLKNSEPLLQIPRQTMANLWIIAAGVLAAAAAALVLRGSRRARETDHSPGASVGAVSEEWLSNARGQGDQGL